MATSPEPEPEDEPTRGQSKEPAEQPTRADDYPGDIEMTVVDASETSDAQVDDTKSVKSEQLEDDPAPESYEQDADNASSIDVEERDAQPPAAEGKGSRFLVDSPSYLL